MKSQLNKQTATTVESTMVSRIPDELFRLPEKVLQFGTGVLLRGLPDFYIDKANKAGVFNGRVLMIKSTDRGGTEEFEEQENLYTHVVRGRVDGKEMVQAVINASISRILTASTQWIEILEAVLQPQLEAVISNTTEVGLLYLEEKILDRVPESFPGKLLAVLYQRYRGFDGDLDKGFVIIPTELIPDNGQKLRDILVKLAGFNELPAKFLEWLENANHFCSSLVDRIVPGMLNEDALKEQEALLGYSDKLLIVSEPYGLWAIESDRPEVKDILSFATVDEGVVVANDISIFRELKLRLLNGSHTLSCGLGVLSGIPFVRNSMQDQYFRPFIERLIFEELIPALPQTIPLDKAKAFARQVLDRYDNPFIDHPWQSITLAYSKKMAMRTLPLLQRYRDINDDVPAAMALGWAGFIRFMKATKGTDGRYYGEYDGRTYLIDDREAAFFAEAWTAGREIAVRKILAQSDLWQTDLSDWEEWNSAVTENVKALEQGRINQVLTVASTPQKKIK